MKEKYLSIAICLLIFVLMGCALIPDRPPTPTLTPAIPPSGYEPQPGDNRQERDQVFLDAQASQLIYSGKSPLQVSLALTGNLSDPCHQLRVVVNPANTNREIKLDVYSVFYPNKACITVLQPFNVSIPLGTYYAGHYSVYVNDDFVGEFNAEDMIPLDP
jgi:hypothetical protein